MRVATMVLGGLGLILGGLIGLELRATPPPAAHGAFALAGPRFVAAAESPPEAATTWVATILARPLFSPTRTPPARPATAGAAAAALPRLAGIMISPMEREAVFMPAGGQPIMAREGGQIGVFTVRLITAESVVVSGPHGFVVLHTAFDDSAAPAAVPPAAASPLGMFGMSAMPGGQWLGNGKIDLPNAATWPGPPPLSRLPAPRPAATGSPLLTPSGPPG